MPWIIAISVFAVLLIGLVVFSWRNAKALTRPKTIGTEREKELMKERGLWLDFDSYDKQDYKITTEDGYVLNTTFVSTESTKGTGK